MYESFFALDLLCCAASVHIHNCHIWGCFHMFEWFISHIQVRLTWESHVTYLNDLWRTCEWVMGQLWTDLFGTCIQYVVVHMKKSLRTYKWVMPAHRRAQEPADRAAEPGRLREQREPSWYGMPDLFTTKRYNTIPHNAVHWTTVTHCNAPQT